MIVGKPAFAVLELIHGCIRRHSLRNKALNEVVSDVLVGGPEEITGL